MTTELFEQPAVREARRLRIALIGPSGSGKTKTALRMAEGLLEPGKRIALLDTEHRSSELYADQHHFFPAYMAAPYAPQRYIGVINAAIARGDVGVLIIDSLSHAWMGRGGVLEQVDQRSSGPRGTDPRAAWKQMTPIQQDLVESIIGAPMHVIITLRTKDAYGQDERGKRVKVGLAPVQREGLDYEMDVALYLDQQHVATVDKSRIPDIMPVGTTWEKPGEDEARALGAWLAAGTKPRADAGRVGGDEPSANGDGGPAPAPAADAAHAAAEDVHAGPYDSGGDAPSGAAPDAGSGTPEVDPFTGDPVHPPAATDATSALRQLIDVTRDALVRLTAGNPDRDDAYWRKKIDERSREWYKKPYADLSPDELADLANRLEQTRIALAGQAKP